MTNIIHYIHTPHNTVFYYGHTNRRDGEGKKKNTEGGFMTK